MRRLLTIVLLVGMTLPIMAIERDSLHYKDGTKRYADTAIYQGTQVRIDVGNMALEMIVTSAKILTFEGSVQVRLKNRFYPTIDMGYANAQTSADGGFSNGQGAFVKLGLDINPFRKHIESPHALVVGLRVGTSFQGYEMKNLLVNDPYWQAAPMLYKGGEFRCDAWGEIVAGVNVQIWEGLMMGWYLRFKLLFTRSSQSNDVMPYYVPGYGYRDNTNWGFNYYIGYRF